MVSTLAQLVDVGELRRDLERAVARVCPAWLAAQRDDVVQSAVMRVIQLLEAGSFQSEGNPRFPASYLYRVAYSAVVDEIRRVRRRRETCLEDAADLGMGGGTDDPERTAASIEIGRGIQGCLARMKRERRLAVTLYLQGHTVVEAARILEWPVKRTENLVYRGLADLRACLASKGMRP
jgi:RNA polymerase sigma-70 factor (ECF subfamily)